MDKPDRLVRGHMDANRGTKPARAANYSWFCARAWYRRPGASELFLFALIGGGVADRVDKRRFLLITQSLSMLLAFILGFLTITGAVQVWMIVVLAFCSGTVLSFDQPTRSSLIPVLVPRQDLMNAISLQSVVFNGSAVIGPALAGIAIGLLDMRLD
jgi:MFS family permease